MLRILSRPLGLAIDNSTLRNLGILSLFTAYCLAMVAMRYAWTGKGSFAFLGWNLFLAWMPVFFSTLAAHFFHRRRSLMVPLLLMVPWLLFLPNAPYIVTDLVHLRPRPGIPYWYDILLISSFAFHGLLLGFYSMRQIHQILVARLRPGYGWALMALASVGAAYGIYLGRVLRWNSWDILRHPLRLAVDGLRPFIHPFAYKEAVVMTVVLAAFLFLGYLISLSGSRMQGLDRQD